jgi:RPA family protein
MRFPAIRVFTKELNKATEEKREQLEKFTVVKVPLKGVDAVRVLVTGVVMNVYKSKSGRVSVIRIADWTGDIAIFAEPFWQEELAPGIPIAVIGKPRIVDGKAMIRAENIIKIDKETYNYLNAQALVYAKQRSVNFAEEVEKKLTQN